MRRLLSLVLVVLGGVLVCTPASAGGPTSVLVTDPGTGRASALHYSDPDYTRLDALLSQGDRLGSRPATLSETSVNVTWMAHDVHPWKVQQVYVDAEGGPVVATHGTEVTGDAGQVSWSRVAAADDLQAVLARVFDAGSDAGSDAGPDAGSGDGSGDVAAPEPVVVEREVPVRETAWFSLAGWRWALPGLVVGAGAVLLLGRRRAPEARQVLVDRTPDVTPPAPVHRTTV